MTKGWKYSNVTGWYRVIQIMPTSRKMKVVFSDKGRSWERPIDGFALVEWFDSEGVVTNSEAVSVGKDPYTEICSDVFPFFYLEGEIDFVSSLSGEEIVYEKD